MGSNRTAVSDGRRFALSIVGFCVLFLAAGRFLGEDVALQLQKTPTTREGYQFFGWLVGGPPFLLAVLLWNARTRIAPVELRNRTLAVSAWIGLGMFILPAKLDSVDQQFGTAALVGDPLSGGWAWAMLANLVAFLFAGAVLLVLHKSVPNGPNESQRQLTVTFLERAWLVVLVAGLGFALYGGATGLFSTTT
ncbi:MAG: hypothetical protein ACJ72O_00420 [Marmoricola sp.]|jgi:hypothetical protein